MLTKIKDNIGLIATAIALMGTVGAGVQATTNIVDSILTVDERMYSLEQQFYNLEETTQVSSEIAILFEKIYQLEQKSYESQYLEERVIYLETALDSVRRQLDELSYLDDRITYLEANMNNSSGGGIDSWEFYAVKDRVLVIETQWGDKWWKFDDYDNRLDWLENNG